MKVLVIGANGKIGQRLVNKLKKSKHEPVAMVRDKMQFADFKGKGVATVLADLEDDFGHAYDGVNAVVFTAGSGGHTPKEKTHLVDRIGAKKAIDQAVKNKVDRFVMVSARGTDRPPEEWPEAMGHYYEAKSDADKHLMQTDLDFTILKAGRLSDENGTNNITLEDGPETTATSIPRDDVATVIEKILDEKNTYRTSLALLSGETPINDAIARI